MSYLLTIASVAVVALSCTLAEAWAPARRAELMGDPVNLPIWAASFVLTPALLSSTAPLLALVIGAAGGGLIVLPESGWGLPISIAAYFIVMDLAEYLFHRAQHKIPFLWKMHSLHHSDREYHFTTAARHFWLDPLVKSLTIWLAVPLFFKVPPAVIGIYAMVSLYHYLVHANVRLDFGRFSWVLNAPAYHRIHHSAAVEDDGCNYASLFPIFDVLTGSYRRPVAGHVPETGLDSGRRPLSFREAMVWPLIVDRVASQPSSGSAQSIGGRPRLSRKALAFEKWRQPKKPLCAEKGDGWGAFSTR